MIDEYKKIMDILKGCVGKKNAMTVREISLKLRRHEDHSCFPTRREIKTIIKEHFYPIGSCNQGYFIIDTKEEFHEYISNLNNRIKGIQDRILAIKRSFSAIHE